MPFADADILAQLHAALNPQPATPGPVVDDPLRSHRGSGGSEDDAPMPAGDVVLEERDQLLGYRAGSSALGVRQRAPHKGTVR